MREKFGIAISVIIALSLLYFIAPMDDLMTLFGRPQNVGEIAGKGIAYEDFQEQINKYTTINEVMTGSSVQNEQTQEQIRNAAWQECIDNFLFVKNAKAAGIKVGEDEKIDLLSGENVSPIISQNPFFADETGTFSADNVRLFVSQLASDETGRLKTYWNYLQNTVQNQQYYAKYGAIFTNGNVQNALQKAADIAENNTTANVEYVLAQYPVATDSTIVVSDSEINAYYKAHKDFYKQNASRDIEYVVFEVVPSAKDIAETSDSFNKVYDEFTATDNMKAFLLKNSERSLSSYWYKAGELNTINRSLNESIFTNAMNTTPIVKDGNTFYAARVVANAMVPDSVYVKHILLQGAETAKADSLLGEVSKKGASFSMIALENSADKGSMADGENGNIGWMTQSYMIPGFESVMTAEVGKPFILKTQYGTHIVLVSKRTAPIAKKQVAILEKTTLASKETFNEYYSKANKFASITAGTYEGYKAAVDTMGIYSHNMNVVEATSNYGSVDNAKEITRWVFDAKKGKASQILTVNNNYFFVAAVKEIHKDGYTPVKEVSESIKNILYGEKVNEKVRAEVAGKIAGLTDMEAIAKALDSSVETNEGASFSTMSQTGLEPAVIGAACALENGGISAPVIGRRGVYVVKVTNKETGSFYTEEDAENMASRKAQYSSQMILPVMMEAAGVQDNRARYF